MSSKEYPSSCLSLVMLGFEFVMLANHDKNLSLIGLEWSTLKSKTKNLSSRRKKMSNNLFHSIGTRSIESRILTKN